MAGQLKPETFLAVTEMVAAHLRIKEVDRWSKHICQLKYYSFTDEFPEVSDRQFLWAAERWIQNHLDPRGFTRYPTWKELMCPLYQSQEGLANRSWGFRPDLPSFVRPSQEQLALLPEQPRSLLPAPDPRNAMAYEVFRAPRPPALPPSEPPSFNDAEWTEYIKRWRATAVDRAERNPKDSAEGTA